MPLIHDCRRAGFDDGLPFNCQCCRRIAKKEAERLIADGHAAWKKQNNSKGLVVEIKSDVVMRHEKHPPRARTIGDRDIERAVVHKNKCEHDRIDTYGKMSHPEVVPFHM